MTPRSLATPPRTREQRWNHVTAASGSLPWTWRWRQTPSPARAVTSGEARQDNEGFSKDRVQPFDLKGSLVFR
jgi:hypothetical protein